MIVQIYRQHQTAGLSGPSLGFIQEFQMEVAALLFASKYGVAAFASVTLAITLLAGGLGLLAHKANQR